MQSILGLIGSIITLPLLAALAAIVRADSPGPAIYRAVRVGAGGRLFTCYKLRTMRWMPRGAGPAISVADDARVTRVGRFLRRTRLDELPQLWNVARGEMLLIGPRPEDPAYVDFSQGLHRRVFHAKPGITGAAQLAYANEAARLEGPDPDTFYRTVILPEKLEIDAAYLARRTLRLDGWIGLQTLATVVGRPPSPVAVRRRLGMTSDLR